MADWQKLQKLCSLMWLKHSPHPSCLGLGLPHQYSAILETPFLSPSCGSVCYPDYRLRAQKMVMFLMCHTTCVLCMELEGFHMGISIKSQEIHFLLPNLSVIFQVNMSPKSPHQVVSMNQVNFTQPLCHSSVILCIKVCIIAEYNHSHFAIPKTPRQLSSKCP